MKLNIGIADNDRQAVVEILNTLLSDEYVLYTKTRNFHWNVTGLQFNDLHKFFEAQYEALDDIIDEVAERARALGARAFGTLEEFRENTRLEREARHRPARRKRHARRAARRPRDAHPRAPRGPRHGRQSHRDVGTTDFLTGLLEQHEKAAWMLRSFLALIAGRARAARRAGRYPVE